MTEFRIKPRLKLIFSADIIGSTALKQKFREKGKASPDSFLWPEQIETFYQVLENEVDASYSDVVKWCKFINGGDNSSDVIDEVLGPRPIFWKTVGDEMLFWKEISHEKQLVLALTMFIMAIDRTRKQLNPDQSPLGERFLDVKTTAWLASFPARNRVTFKRDGAPRIKESDEKSLTDALAEEEQRRSFFETLEDFYSLDDRPNTKLKELEQAKRSRIPHYDFIGPAIDVGFRLSSFASSKKMVIDIGIASMLARIFCGDDLSEDGTAGRCLKDRKLEKIGVNAFPDNTGLDGTMAERLGVYYSGREPLKGVLGGMPYPKFWINASYKNTLEQKREAAIWSPSRTALAWKGLHELCESLFEHRQNYLLRPFIDGSEVFPPDESYSEYHREFESRYLDEDD